MAHSFRLLKNAPTTVSLRNVREAAANHEDVLNQHAITLNTELIPAVKALGRQAMEVELLLRGSLRARLWWVLTGELPERPAPPAPSGPVEY